MEQKRFATDEETSDIQSCDAACVGGNNDSDNRDAVKGYKKIACVILMFVAVLFIKFFVFDIVTVYGDSMNHSFYEDDVLIVVCTTNGIERFDVVVAKVSKKTLIKRVIGLPNETVQIKDGKVYINGEEVIGEFAFYTEDAGVASEPYTLGKDEYFLLGDNRGNSNDSREFGSVNVEKIKGIVTFRIFPFDGFGRVAHREENE